MSLPRAINNLARSYHSEKWYGYVRLSKDENPSKNDSIIQQANIIRKFASDNNFTLTEIFEDDDVSGYEFDRNGLNNLINLIEDGKCTGVVVKDQSRLGRHNSNTLGLIDFFYSHDVRFILVTQNFDSEYDDDSILGINAWADERYVRDCSVKQRSSVKSRQESRGVIVLPPFGYKKVPSDDKSSLPEIVIDDNSAFIVKEIFDLYLEGNGTKAISKILNERGRITPNQAKQAITGKVCNQGRNLWYNTAVGRILKDESYTGTLVNRKTVRKRIKDKKKNFTEDKDRIRHEGIYPVLIEPDIFAQVQDTLVNRKVNSTRAGANKIHLFTGILKCKKCGAGFVYRSNSYAGQGFYKCGTNHKLGKEYCDTGSIGENELKEIVMKQIANLFHNAEINHDKIDSLIEQRKKKSFNYRKTAMGLRSQLIEIENRIQTYVIEKNNGKLKPQMADRFIEKDNAEYDRINEQIQELEKLDMENNVTKTQMIKSIDILKAVNENKEVNRTIIELMLEKVEVTERADGKVDLDFHWSAPFSYHEDTPLWQGRGQGFESPH